MEDSEYCTIWLSQRSNAYICDPLANSVSPYLSHRPLENRSAPFLTYRTIMNTSSFPHISQAVILGRDTLHKITLLHGIVKLREAALSFVMTVRPHRITQLPLDGFS
jgi:hypothetical protein